MYIGNYRIQLMAMFLSISSFSVHALTTQKLQYNVFLDGDKIGYHRVSIQPVDSRKIVQVEASFNVKFLIFNAYQYHHVAKEQWSNNCLTSIRTSTDDNGDKLFVNGMQQRNVFKIDSNDGSKLIDGCVKSFAYWDPQLLQASHLLNTQTGQYTAVKTLRLGEEEISLGQRKVNATHYQIISDEFVIDLWYSDEQEWLALSTVTESGAKLRYEKR